jgi:hypothetical protein
MLTEKQLKALVRSYRKRALCHNVASYAQIEAWRDVCAKCYGRTDDGLAFVVHRSPSNDEMAYSVGDSLEEILLLLSMAGAQSSLDLARILDREDVN